MDVASPEGVLVCGVDVLRKEYETLHRDIGRLGLAGLIRRNIDLALDNRSTRIGEC